MRLKINSERTAVTTDTVIRRRAIGPKRMTDATAAGRSAIITSSIIFCVVEAE